MSLFADPAEHAANPPASWQVVKTAPRRWALKPTAVDNPYVLGTFNTRRAAEAAKVDGWWAALYAQEARWYAGEPVANWKPYAVVAAERAALEAKLAARTESVHNVDKEARA